MKKSLLKNIFVGSTILVMLCCLFLGNLSQVQAQTNTNSFQNTSLELQIQSLLKILVQLQAQLLLLQKQAVVTPEITQGTAPEHTYKKTSNVIEGPIGIDISAPLRDLTYDKANPLTDVLDFSWKATNVPLSGKNEVVVETKRTKLFDYSSAVGGFVWTGELPSGDSTGNYRLDISGNGVEGAGEYQARVKIRQCDFTKVKYCDDTNAVILATSPWVPYTITDSKQQSTKAKSCTIKTDKSSYTVGETIKVSWTSTKFGMPYLQDNNKAGGSFEVEKSGSTKFKTFSAYQHNYSLQDNYSGYSYDFKPSCTVKVDVVDNNALLRAGEIIFNQRSLGNYKNASESQMQKYCKDTIAILKKGSESGDLICTWGNDELMAEKIIASASNVMQTAIAFGAYEGSYPSGVTHSGNFHTQGEITVYIPDGSYNEKSVLLMLTAYEPVKWKITGPGAKMIGTVWMSGYYEQEAVGLDSSVKFDYGGKFYTYKAQGQAYTNMMGVAQDKYGTEIQQFMGSYSAKEFKLSGFKG